MTDDDGAGPGGSAPRARRPRRRIITALATVLVVGGASAVAYGVVDQDPDPVAPRPVAASSPTPTRAAPEPPQPEPTPTPAPDPHAPPVRVTIPAIGVDSDLTYVGLNPDGTLEVPQRGPDYDKAAWYDGSPVPGQVGPAVIIGHVDGIEGPSVFYRLGALAPGDMIDVARQDGSTARFVVDSVQAFPKNAFPTDLVYGDTSRPELRLITCGGEFDRSAQSHVDNTVVFAHQV
ncbi:class F sortase [uncultured Cellulomonas sp.]|uniref:class F sortase n=1 Tax=uncultured Cellulomonas sp. TaxID=189682 RepID=UPI00261D85B0|nr:class F sortase [uncultured Cellulomonas sp.]